MLHFPAVGSQTVVKEHRGEIPSRANVLSGVTPSNLTGSGSALGRNMVGLKRPQILDRLGTLFLVSLTLLYIRVELIYLFNF
jgi:hypothetical protein